MREIEEDEIALMYVWIPRYKYVMFNAHNEAVEEQQIQVIFENGTNSTGTVRCVDAINQYDENGNLILRVKSLEDLYDGEDLIQLEDNSVAKDLLNVAGRDDLANNLTARLSVETLNGCGKSLNEVTNNEFDVKFLRPITVKADKMDNFKDGVDVGAEGSVIDVKLAFTDWRNYAFVTTPINYYTYYGVKSITIDTDKAQTTVNGKYEPIQAGMKVEYSGVEDISAGKFGKLTYINNKAEVGEFDIKLPVAVEYAWGTVEFDIVCHVVKTVK